jgi:hypothetical protein
MRGDIEMQNWFQWFLNLVVALLPLLLKAEVDGGSGADKKAAVLAAIKAHIKDPKIPVNVPSWIPESLLDWVLSMLVDFLINQLNKLSFFKT